LNPTHPRSPILVVDDEQSQRDTLARMLEAWGYAARKAANGREALAEIAASPVDAVVTDLHMPEMDGREFLAELRKTGDAPPAIVLTAFGGLETAVELVHDLGAFWFQEKPIEPKALRLLLERAVEQRRLTRQTATLERQLSHAGVLGDMVGRSHAMREVFALIEQVAPTEATLLITGDTGTGKEVAARAVHRLSRRKSAPFLAINCAALPESLIESELFGHEKGAFTGAAERRAGCFELANGGTLLLDEIGEMPLATQSKLLRVLEERKVRRLGATRETPVDVRILAATNRNPQAAVDKGEFRADLYFRLNVFELKLPALFERLDDIEPIVASLIPTLNRRHECRVTGIDPEAIAVLKRHTWPGNVRELRNVAERALILAGEGLIRPAHLPPTLTGAAERAPRTESGAVTLRPGVTIDEAERALITLTLDHAEGNRTRAAGMLGVSVKTLFNKLKQYSGEP